MVGAPGAAGAGLLRVRECSDKGGLQYGCIVECKAREKAGAATDAATLQHDAADAPLRFPNTAQMGRVMSPTRLLGQPSYDGPQCPRSAASDADIHARRPYVVVGHRRLSAMEGPYLVQTLGLYRMLYANFGELSF